MARYRKRPVVVEAYCYTQSRDNFRPDWFQDAVSANVIVTHPDCAFIATLEGQMRADLGDWVIKGVKGELYPCKPDIFEATHEPYEGEAPGPVPFMAPCAASPSHPAPSEGEIEALKRTIDYLLNDYLCEMKPDYDDSITGFNEAWTIINKAFADAALRQHAPAGEEK